MTYAPISGPPYDVYTLAFTGAMNGMVNANRVEVSALSSTYALYAARADAWAQAWDTAFNSATALDEIQASMIWNISTGFWGDATRVTIGGVAGIPAPTEAEAYVTYVDAGLAAITAVEDQFAAQGIAVPPWRGGGSSPIVLVPKEVVYGSSIDGIAQDNQFERTTGSIIAPSTAPPTDGTVQIDGLFLSWDGSNTTMYAAGNIEIQPQGPHGAGSNGGNLTATGGNTTTGTGGAAGLVGGPASGSGTGGMAFLQVGSTGSGRPGQVQLRDVNGGQALGYDGFSNLLTIDYPLKGDVNTNDTLRFGATDIAISTGANAVPATAARSQVLVFSGSMAGDTAITFTTPTNGQAGGFAKLLDLQGFSYGSGTLTVHAGTATPLDITTVVGDAGSGMMWIWLSDDGTYLSGGQMTDF